MRVLIWHVHGGWMESFVRGTHEYLLPVNESRDGWGLGRGGRNWPAAAREVDHSALVHEPIDVVVLQRVEEFEQCRALTGRTPGLDLPAVFLEHNTPVGPVPDVRHPCADAGFPIVHVAHFNQLMWDTGRAHTRVIEHGIVDPGYQYRGDRRTQAVVSNDPVRRWRRTGADLLADFAAVAPIDVFGIGTSELAAAVGLGGDRLQVFGDLPTSALHAQLAAARLYLHTARWTSLGLSLLEAMHLGMPVVALAATEAPRAVPPEAGAISADLVELRTAVRKLLDDPDHARACGQVAREAALDRYGLTRFLIEWDDLLDQAVSGLRHRSHPRRTV